MRIKRCFLIVSLFLLLSSALFAQADDWYYNKPIKKITFSGLKTIQLVELDSVITPFKGQLFTDELWMDMLNRVYALDYFEDIDVSLDPNNDRYEQVVIKFTVVEKPVVKSISFKGNVQIHSSELREAISLKKGDIFVSSKVLVAERKIRDTYLEKGYTNVKVSSDYEETKKGIELTFSITEGSATVINEIRFEGNELFNSKTLKGQLTLKESTLFNRGPFKESNLESDIQKLTMYYLDRGFIDAQIQDVRREITWNESKKQDEMDLTFVIYEGSKYSFGGMTITGNTIFSDETLMNLVTLRTGGDFNTTRYQTSISDIANLYYENGYTSNDFIPQLDRNIDTRVITCTLIIVEKPRSHVENVIVRGNTKTKEYVITREMPLEAGDIFSKTKLINGLRNLYNTQYFSAIEPEIVQGSEENLVDLIINVEEGQTHTLEFGVTFSGVTEANEFPVSIFIQNNNTNVGGEGKAISEKLSISNTEQTVGVSYTDYWAFEKPITFQASLDFSHSTELTLQKMYFGDGVNTTDVYMSYEKYDMESGVALGRRWNPTFGIFSINGGIYTDIVNNQFDSDMYEPVDSTILANNGSLGLSNTLWTSVSIDDRDVYYDPKKGWFASEKLSFTGLLPNVEADYFLRSDTKLEGYIPVCSVPVSDNFTLDVTFAALTTLSNLTPFFGDEISHSNQLYIDGMFNARGWRWMAGTRGHTLWSSSLELRAPLVPGMLAADFYFDAAVLKSDMNALLTTTSIEDFYFAFGPGLRFSIPQFPIRMLFANTFKVKNGQIEWEDKGAFTLSFNIANR